MQCQKLKTYMETGRVVFLPARSIRPNPAQPRKIFCPDAMTELAESIRQHGILQPLSVRRVGTFYELIAGERRLRAGIQAGLTEIPCIVMRMTEQESAMTALVENLQRQDLNPVEEALGYQSLMNEYGLTQEDLALKCGVGLNFVRQLEQGKPTLRMDKVNQVLAMFGYELAPVRSEELNEKS